MNHAAPHGSILCTDVTVGDINVESCEGLLKGVLEAFLFWQAGGHQASVSRGLPISLELSALECEC